MSTKKPLRAAIYIRQSKTYEDSISPELQEANCRKLAKREGWTITDVYSDIGISGKSTVKREGLRKLRRDRKARQFDIALADDLSRFSRNTADAAIIQGEMPTATWKEGIQDNRLFADILNSFNSEYLRQITARWDDALMRRLEAGLPASGRVQYGYTRLHPDGTPITKAKPKVKSVNETYAIHPEESKIVQEIYRRYTAGEGVRLIVADLIRRDVPAPGPAGWQTVGMFDLMDKPFYAGIIRNLTAVRDENGAVIMDDEGNPVKEMKDFPGAHEPLLTEAQWKAYLKARADRKIHDRPRNPKWWLTGIAKCGRCGSGLVSHKDSKGSHQLMCQLYSAKGKDSCAGVFRKRVLIDTKVWFWLGAHLKEWASALPSDDNARATAEKAVEDAQAAKDVAQGRIAGLMSRAARFDLSDDEIAAPLEEFKAELAEATQASDDALATLGAYVAPEGIYETIQRGSELLGSNDGEEEMSEEATAQLREAISKIIDKVVVMPQSTGSTRDPARDLMSEIIIVPR